MSLTDLFTDLEVLSMIKEHDKLCIREGCITIEQKSNPVSTAFRRWFNNDSRRIMIMKVNTIINLAVEAYNSEVKMNIDSWNIKQFQKHFRNVIEGLNNLKKTYFNDSSIVARLNVLNEQLYEIVSVTENDSNL